MPGFFSKLKSTFTGSNSSLNSKRSKSTQSLNYGQAQCYNIKEKDLKKLHLAAWKGDLSKVKSLCKPDKLNELDKEGR